MARGRQSKTINIEKTLKAIPNAALRRVLSRKNMARFMIRLSKTIRIRTRLGFNAIDNNTSRKRIKALKPSTIKGRERFKKNGRLSSKTTPRRSNLTRTGQMLEALTGFGLGFGRGVVRIKGTSRNDTNQKNSDIARFAEEHGRPFLNLTSKEVKELGQQIKKQLVKRLRK